MRIGKAARSGFVSLELGPSLLLLAGVLVVFLKIVAIGMRFSQSSREATEMAASLEAIWTKWNESGGRVAMATREHSGNWSIIDFPDETWLPFATTNEGGENSTFLWRRKVRAMERASFWEVEWMNGETGAWEWRDSVVYYSAYHEDGPE